MASFVVVQDNNLVDVETEEAFITKPGNVITLEDIKMLPGQVKTIIVALCDAPRLRLNATLKVFPTDVTALITISHASILLQNFRLEITLSNDNKSVNFNVKRGTVIATAIADDASSVLSHRSTSFYSQLFLRLFCSVKSADFSGVTVDRDGRMTFGPLFNVTLDKKEKVVCKNGTAYSLETVVSFLTHYNSSDAVPYANYLEAAIEGDAEDLVDERDAEPIHRYFHGHDNFLLIRKKQGLKRKSDMDETDPIYFGNHPQCLAEVGRLGICVLSRMVQRYMSQSKLSEKDAKERLENVLTLLNVAKCDVAKLASKTTHSRLVFERSIRRKLLRMYEENPDALEDCRTL